MQFKEDPPRPAHGPGALKRGAPPQPAYGPGALKRGASPPPAHGPGALKKRSPARAQPRCVESVAGASGKRPLARPPPLNAGTPCPAQVRGGALSTSSATGP